jgi:ABC-type transporter Mla subunit MlaD
MRDLARNPKLLDALAHVDSTLARVESASKRLDELLARPSLAASIDDFAASAASLKRMTADLETTIPKLTQNLDATLAAAHRAFEESKLPETTAAARDVMVDVAGAARQLGAMREAARHTLTDLGEASRSLSALVRYIEENPDALIRGKTEAVR